MAASTDALQERLPQQLYEDACRELSAGRSPKQLVQELVHQHRWPEPVAQEFTRHVVESLHEQHESPAGRGEQAKKGLMQLQSGVTWMATGFVGALAVKTMITQWVVHLVVVGVIVFGFYEICAGGWRWFWHREFLQFAPAKEGKKAEK